MAHKIGRLHKNKKVCLKVRGTRVLFVLDNVIIKGCPFLSMEASPIVFNFYISHAKSLQTFFSHSQSLNPRCREAIEETKKERDSTGQKVSSVFIYKVNIN